MSHEAFDRLDEVVGITEFRHRGNGLRVLHLPDVSTATATVMVTYLVGSRHETTGLTGATHFLEHLMFKGTERYNRDRGTSVFQTLQRLGAQVNATTWVDRTNYYAMLPSMHVGTAIQIEADRMRGARIRPEDVADERSVILNELDRGQNEPARRLYQAVFDTAFEVHPYRHPTIGIRGDVAAVTSQALRGFYDTFYWPDNAVASVIGNVDESMALSLLDEGFGQIPRSPAPVPDAAVSEPEQTAMREAEVRMTGDPPAIMMAWKGPGGTETAADALALLGMVLSSGRLGRLYRTLVDTGLALSQAATVTRYRDPGLFYIYAMLAPGVDHGAVEAVIRNDVQRIVDNGVSQEELERAQSQLRAQEAFNRDGPFALAGQLNEAIAAGDWRLFAMLRERIGRLTAEDVAVSAARYLRDETLTVGRFIPTRG